MLRFKRTLAYISTYSDLLAKFKKINKENTRSNKLKEVDRVGLSSRIVFASLVVVRCGSDDCLKACICLNIYVIMS